MSTVSPSMDDLTAARALLEPLLRWALAVENESGLRQTQRLLAVCFATREASELAAEMAVANGTVDKGALQHALHETAVVARNVVAVMHKKDVMADAAARRIAHDLLEKARGK